MNTPLYCLSPLFQTLSTTTPPQFPCDIQPPPPLFFLLSCFFSWMGDWLHHIWCVILLNDNIDLHMSSLVSLVPEGLCFLHQKECVFYAIRHQVYWGQIHQIHLISYVDWYTHINIYLHQLLFAHSSYLFYIKWLNE